MNGRYKHLMGLQGIDISEGQVWIRSVKASKINHPLNIEIITTPDPDEPRYYVRNVKNGEYLFFDRSDIINNYGQKLYPGKMSINDKVCEIKGWRWYQEEGKGWVMTGPNGQKNRPRYDKSKILADELLADLQKYEPKIKVKMSQFILYLDRAYVGITREESICVAWIDKNE